MKKAMLMLLLLLTLPGCTHVISDRSRAMVDPSVTYPLLHQNPEQFKGRYVLVGGAIASVTNRPEGGQLEVVQLPVDRQGMPEDTFNTGGRFLAMSDRFLDPLVFKEGKRVTIVGEVTGVRVKTLDQVNYRYPEIGIREVYVWRPEEVERQNYSQPYPYYWHDPWWPYWYYRPGPFRPW